jgi:hypothetical protein
MQMKHYFTFSNLRLAIEILLVIIIAASAFSTFRSAQGASVAAPDAPDAAYWYQCNSPSVEHVAVFTNRVHVWCQSTTAVGGAPALSGIYWFAFPTSNDSAAASRFLSLFQTSAISGRYVWLEVNPTDTSGSSFGCAAGDCRRVFGAELR